MGTVNVPARDMRFPAILSIVWTLAGGLLFGGVGVAIMQHFNAIAGPLILMAASTLFLIGAGIGLAHSLVLGYFGREPGTTWRDNLKALKHGLLYFIPALLLGWVVTGWVAALPIALATSVIGSFVSISAWVILLFMVFMAISMGWEGLTRAYGGWQDRVLGTLATAGALVSLLLLFYISNHPVWFTAIQLTTFGKAFFSMGVALWIYGPITTLGLYLLHQKLNRTDIAEARFPATKVDWKRFALDAMHVVVVGFLMAMLLLPFYNGVSNLPTLLEKYGILYGILLSMSAAVSNELFLRLFLFTLIFWFARKHWPTKETRALWIAIAASALIDGLFHTNELPALGFGTLAMSVSYVVVHVILPSVAFGYLYWKRGLATAMGAHAMSGIFLGLLAL